jgi:hypothetical protein
VKEASLIHRIWQVLLTYLTRPMVWTVGGIYLVSLGAALVDTVRQFLSSEPVIQVAAYPELPNPRRQSTISDSRGIDQLMKDSAASFQNVERLTIDRPASVNSAGDLRRLQSCSTLKVLKLASRFELTEDLLEALSELQMLEAISFRECEITSSVWKTLGRLKRLRFLEFDACRLRGAGCDLSSLKQLQTLILGPAAGGMLDVDPAFYSALPQLPRLTTLVLGDFLTRPAGTDPGSVDALLNVINPLREIPSLQTVFVNDLLTSFPGFDRLQSLQPEVRFRPSFVDLGRQQMFLVLIGLNLVLQFLLGLQLHSQFTHAAARLMPNYARPHMIPPLFLGSMGILLHCVPLLQRQVPPAPALAVNLTCWLVLCGLQLAGLQARPIKRQSNWLGIVIVIASLLSLSAIVYAFQANPSSIDWFLRGHMPITTGLLIVCGLTIPIALLWRMLRLHSIYLELGYSTPPLDMDSARIAAWSQEVRSNPNQIRAERSLQRAIAQAGHSGWRHRCNLWIAGNVVNGNLIAPFSFSIAVAFLIGTSFIQSDLRWTDLLSSGGFAASMWPALLMMSVFIPDLGIIPLNLVWRGRRKFLAVESLRPVSRSEFSRQTACAIAWDFLPLAGVYLTVLAFYVAHADPNRWSWGWTAAMLLVFVSRWILVYGVVLWTMTIRRDWVVMLMSVIVGYAIAFANVAVILLQSPVLGISPTPSDMPEIGVAALTGIALLFICVSVTVASLAYRRWQQVELV